MFITLTKKYISILLLICFYFSTASAGEMINLDASNLVARSEITVTPNQASFIEGSIFDVPVVINTKGRSINAIDLKINFDPKRLSIIRPSTGKSIIGLWIQPPSYDNTKGVVSIVGSIPGGIISDASIISTLTFQAKATGVAEVRINDSSSVLANDGVGTTVILSSNRGIYTILPKPPSGLNVYSDTHQFQDHWYNNNSPTFSWNKDPGVIGFSYILDDKPNTIPDNKNSTTESVKSYENISDGLMYFHIKALKDKNTWGSTTHYLLRIDTKPPALFTPKVDYIINDDGTKRALVSFFTSDNMSGIDHYEVGVIEKNQPTTVTPIFVRTESPYEVPSASIDGSVVVVRAYDLAGNSVDSKITLHMPGKLLYWIEGHATILLLILLLLVVAFATTHYLLGHKILKRIRLISRLLNKNDTENTQEFSKEVSSIESIKDI
ncbi:MAG: cohesin domain-containing protein [bacterium]